MAGMEGGKLSLEWTNFPRFTSAVFRELSDRQEFSDVTLVCGDGHQVAAHKVMLASCSKFFQGILRQNPHPNPLIYLDAIDPNQLDALVAFVYTGEVTIASHELDNFLTAAQKLKVAGLLEEELGREYEEREVNTPRFVKRELKMEQDAVSLDVLTEVDVLGDGDQDEEDDEEEDVNDGEESESEQEDMDEEEMGGDEDIEMDKEANAWVGNENELLHVKFDSNQEEEGEEEEKEEVKDVKLKLEEEERMENLRIEDGEVACKGEVETNKSCLLPKLTIFSKGCS